MKNKITAKTLSLEAVSGEYHKTNINHVGDEQYWLWLNICDGNIHRFETESVIKLEALVDEKYDC